MKKVFRLGEVVSIGSDDLEGARYLYGSSSAYYPPENFVEPGWRLLQGKHDGGHLLVGYVRGDWTQSTGFAKPYQGTIAYHNANGSKVWVASNGSLFTRHYTMAPNRGYVHVFLDGNYLGLMNDYAPTVRWQAAKTWSMPWGDHLMEFRLPDNSGQYMDSDAYSVNTVPCAPAAYEEQSTCINRIGNWTLYAGGGPSGGSVVFSKSTDDAVYLTFTGSAVRYVFTKAYNRGKAGVTIDGVERGFVDLYSPTIQWQQSVTYSNLGGGVHTIHVSVAGLRHPSATDVYIDIDRFDVLQ